MDSASSRSSSSSSSSSDSDTDSAHAPSHGTADLKHGGRGNSAGRGDKNSSSTAGLALTPSIYYDVTQLVTDYDAIHVFSLRHCDLQPLKHQRRYISGVNRHGMKLKYDTKLYNRSEIEAAAQQRREAKAANEQARKDKELAWRVAHRKLRKQVASQAQDQVGRFSSSKRSRHSSSAAEKHGAVKLPDAVLQKIIGCLAGIDVLEVDGLRGPSMVANDLANAALVSWDFYNAAKHGFVQLQQHVKHLNSTRRSVELGWAEWLKQLPAKGGLTWQQWGALLSNPLPYKVPELKAAAKQLGLPSSGSKAELVVRVLGAFGLKAPSTAPPQLLRGIAVERQSLQPWQGCGELMAPREVLAHLFNFHPRCEGAPYGITKRHLRAAGSAAGWRKLLASLGVESKAQLRELTRLSEAAWEVDGSASD